MPKSPTYGVIAVYTPPLYNLLTNLDDVISTQENILCLINSFMTAISNEILCAYLKIPMKNITLM